MVFFLYTVSRLFWLLLLRFFEDRAKQFIINPVEWQENSHHDRSPSGKSPDQDRISAIISKTLPHRHPQSSPIAPIRTHLPTSFPSPPTYFRLSRSSSFPFPVFSHRPEHAQLKESRCVLVPVTAIEHRVLPFVVAHPIKTSGCVCLIFSFNSLFFT